MKHPLLVLTILLASGVCSAQGARKGVQVGPMGPSAEMAARLKTNPTSSWLAHYLPDDRYKIAGGVWKYVSTDLDTYYHRPNSALMLRQPAGLVIGFSSAKEAEDAGYRPAPGIVREQQVAITRRAQAASAASPRINVQLLKAMGALREISAISSEQQRDGSRNLPVIKQRLERIIVLLNDIPVTRSQRVPMSTFKGGLRSLVTALDLQSQGRNADARRQLGIGIAMIQRGSLGLQGKR